MNVLQQGVTLKKAAKLAGKRPAFIRQLVADGFLTVYRDGGNDAHPRLKVLPADLDDAIRRATVYVPSSPSTGRRRSRNRAELHPLVKC